MSTTSKSPRRVIEVALEVAKQSLPEYSHEFSPKKFTQHQLFACLVLKSFLKCTKEKPNLYLKRALILQPIRAFKLKLNWAYWKLGNNYDKAAWYFEKAQKANRIDMMIHG